MGYIPSHDPEDDFAVEITSLDDTPEVSETSKTPARISALVLQGPRLAPRVRMLFTIASVLGGILLVVVVLSTVLPSFLPKTTNPPQTISHLPPAQISDVMVQNNVAYITSSDGMLRALRVEDGKMLWQRKSPDVTPSFLNGTIYINYYEQNSYIVEAIRASTGSIVWTFKNTSVFSPLIIADGVAYPLFSPTSQDHYTVIALNAIRGAEIWHYNIFASSKSSDLFMYYKNDKVYITIESNDLFQNVAFSVLRMTDGRLLWHYSPPAGIHTSPSDTQFLFTSSTFPGNLVYVTTNDGSLKALSTEDGHQIWQYKSPTQGEVSPITGTNLFYIQAMDGSLKALRADNGALLWTYKDPWGVSQVFPEVDGILYLETGDGFIIALRASDGTRLWHVRPVVPPFTFGSVEVVDGIVYTFSAVGDAKDETVAALRVSDGSLLWRHKVNLPDNLLAPLISNDVFFTDSGDTTVALRASDGVVLWQTKHQLLSVQSRVGLLNIVGDLVLLHSSDSSLEAHRLDTGAVVWRYPAIGGMFLGANYVDDSRCFCTLHRGSAR